MLLTYFRKTLGFPVPVKNAQIIHNGILQLYMGYWRDQRMLDHFLCEYTETSGGALSPIENPHDLIMGFWRPRFSQWYNRTYRDILPPKFALGKIVCKVKWIGWYSFPVGKLKKQCADRLVQLIASMFYLQSLPILAMALSTEKISLL